tara:strand:+ start:6638 stop:9424 length:2787 start_codon:yes stop_codon:yes gene_type:complete
MPGGSPVTQAAIARLGVQVALPSRGDIARGLNWLPGVISGVFKQLNKKKNAALQEDLSASQDALHKLVGTEQNIRASRDSAIRSAEQASLGDSLKAYRKSIKDGKSMVRNALQEPYQSKAKKNFMGSIKGWGNLGAKANKAMNKLFKDGRKDFDLMREASKAFYALDEKGREQMLDGLRNELITRKDKLKALQDEQKLLQGLKDKSGQFIGADGSAQTYAEKEADIKAEVSKAGHAAGLAAERFKFFGETLNKNKEGTAAYNKEVKETRTRIEMLTNKINKLKQRYDELGIVITQKVSAALQGFRSILQQSVITLTLFYYKLNQVVDGFMQFEKELINAQSIFQTTNETLYTLSNQIVRFGTEFGISYDNAAKGLYQFASAGLSAEDSIKVLNDTLKLSMAVQGDHNTISKLTTQVIFGFGLGMDQATEVTDKFAHAINKSLIEYQDLASAIKFSMPFFVSSGQSLDTLLGALQVLTNRALEAGIAGRGLRQALAEFTQHADDNQAAFRKLGVEILDTEGNMFDLTHIAHQFNDALGEQASDMEVMMTLMDDLNIRGATAFIHLVQNADEFSAAVDDLKNSTGAAHEMAMIQQESLFNQIQILKNALLAPFLLADPAAVARGEMNEFAESVHGVVASLKDMLIVETENGQALSEFGFQLRNIAVVGLQRFGELLDRAVSLLVQFTEAGVLNFNLLKLYFLPLSIIVTIFEILGPNVTRAAMAFYVLNKALALTVIIQGAYTTALFLGTNAFLVSELVMGKWMITGFALQLQTMTLTVSFGFLAAAIFGAIGGLYLGYQAGKAIADSFGPVITVVLGLALAFGAMWAAASMGASVATTLSGWAALTVGMAGVGIAIGGLGSAFKPDADAFDMSGYEAQLQGNYSFNGESPSGSSQEALYVNKLVYTDSNVSEQMRTSAQMQQGATGEFN